MVTSQCVLTAGGWQLYNFPLMSYSETSVFCFNIYSENIWGYCLQLGLKNKCQLDYTLVYHIHIAVQESSESITSAILCITDSFPY